MVNEPSVFELLGFNCISNWYSKFWSEYLFTDLFYPGYGSLAVAVCEPDGHNGAKWGAVTFKDNCKAVPILQQSNSTKTLKMLSEVRFSFRSCKYS